MRRGEASDVHEQDLMRVLSSLCAYHEPYVRSLESCSAHGFLRDIVLVGGRNAEASHGRSRSLTSYHVFET